MHAGRMSGCGATQTQDGDTTTDEPAVWIRQQTEARLLEWLRLPTDDLQRRVNQSSHLGITPAIAAQLREHPARFHTGVALALYGETGSTSDGAPGPKRQRLMPDSALPPQQGITAATLRPQSAASRRFARLSTGCDVLDRALR